MEIFENSSFGSEMKKKTYIAGKQCNKLDITYEFDRIKGEKPKIKKYNRSNLKSSSKHCFLNVIKLILIVFFFYIKMESSFYNELMILYSLKPQKKITKKKKSNCV